MVSTRSPAAVAQAQRSDVESGFYTQTPERGQVIVTPPPGAVILRLVHSANFTTTGSAVCLR